MRTQESAPGEAPTDLPQDRDRSEAACGDQNYGVSGSPPLDVVGPAVVGWSEVHVAALPTAPRRCISAGTDESAHSVMTRFDS